MLVRAVEVQRRGELPAEGLEEPVTSAMSAAATSSAAGPNISSARAGSARTWRASVRSRQAGAPPGPAAAPRAATVTPGRAASAATACANRSRMSGVSMVCGTLSRIAAAAASAKASRSEPAIPISRPGLVQNCPAPSVSDWTKPAARDALRARRAPGRSTTGLTALISA